MEAGHAMLAFAIFSEHPKELLKNYGQSHGDNELHMLQHEQHLLQISRIHYTLVINGQRGSQSSGHAMQICSL